jgi:hypothetical protein
MSVGARSFVDVVVAGGPFEGPLVTPAALLCRTKVVRDHHFTGRWP